MMVPDHLHYLLLMILFTFVPIGLLWRLRYPLMIKNIGIIVRIAALGLVYQLISDPFAEAWGAWSFGEGKNLGVWVFNFPIENSIYSVLISVAIASGTIAFADYLDRGRLGLSFKKIFGVKNRF